MRLTEIDFTGQPPVDAYGPGFFRVGGTVITGALLIGPDGILPWAGEADTGPLLALTDVDVLLYGTGAETKHPPTALRHAFEAAGTGLEAMMTPSACRTYNVLLGEGRRVAVALLPV